MEITRPSITRLARKAGVKSIADECYNNIRAIIEHKLHSVIKNAIVVNSEHQTTSLMPEDVHDAITLSCENLAQSHNLGTNTINK